MKRTEAGQLQPHKDRATVLISANSFWNIVNFRTGLIQALARQGYRVTIAAPGSDPDWISAMGAKAINIEMDRSGLNPLKDLSLLFAYHRLLRRYRPNIFIGFTAKPNIYGCLAARWSGVSALPNVSGLGTAFINPGPLSVLVGTLYRIAFAKCPVIYFQNSDDGDLFIRRKIVRSAQVRLLPGSGVDLDRFSPSPPNAAAGVSFLFIGRLLGDKGVREFVAAARILRAERPDWRFQLLGPIDEGNRSGIKQAELDQWAKDEVVEYLGQADDVRPFISAATAVVLPSYREGLPRSLLEAAAMARPLVATDVPGNRRIVEQGINGFSCKARDPQSLADAMARLGTMDAGARSAMGSASRELVEREFGEERVIEAYLDTMRQLLDDVGVESC